MVEGINACKTIFVFPGQGSQALAMGKDLFDKYKCAADVFNEVDAALERNLFRDVICGTSNEELCKTHNAQPALMAVSIATLKVLQEVTGRKISDLCVAVAGHSLGEYTALCASEALSLFDTAKILFVRGEAMRDAAMSKPGSMLAVMGNIDVITEIINKTKGKNVLVMANDNSNGQIVLSGETEAIARAEILAGEMNIRAIKLNVAGAFHSPLMQEANDKMAKYLDKIKINTPKVTIISNVSTKSESNPDEIIALLKTQIVSCVKWKDLMLNALNLGLNRMVEIGSGKVLCGLAKRISPDIVVSNVEKEEDIEKFKEMLV